VFEDHAKEPRVIQTIAKRGYRLLPSVTLAKETVEVIAIPGLSSEPASIAVVPMANPDGSPDMEHLLSGIPGTIIRGLSPLPGLTVVSGRLAPGDGNGEGNTQAFRKKFFVRSALRGRLLKRRTRLRLQVDLIDTKTGAELGPTSTIRTSPSFTWLKTRLSMTFPSNCE